MSFTALHGTEDKYMQEVDAWYYDECRSTETRAAAYDALLSLDNELCPLSAIHYARRGDYRHYPTRMVTHSPTELFVHCCACSRAFCTDAWRPYSYATVDAHVVLQPDGRYKCRDTQQCRR